MTRCLWEGGGSKKSFIYGANTSKLYLHVCPQSMCTLSLCSFFTTPFTHSTLATLFSPNTSGMVSPQNLCTCYSCDLEDFPSDNFVTASLSSFGLLLTCPFFERPSLVRPVYSHLLLPPFSYPYKIIYLHSLTAILLFLLIVLFVIAVFNICLNILLPWHENIHATWLTVCLSVFVYCLFFSFETVSHWLEILFAFLLCLYSPEKWLT